MTTLVAAVAAGVGVLLAGNLPWAAVLAPLNLRMSPVVPGAIAPMALYLWLYWRYIGGRLGAAESAGFRRTSLRANPLTAPVWAMAILTGLVGFATLVALLRLMARIVAVVGHAVFTGLDDGRRCCLPQGHNRAGFTYRDLGPAVSQTPPPRPTRSRTGNGRNGAFASLLKGCTLRSDSGG